MDVKDGQLNIFQGIEGSGKLDIAVDANGALVFEKGGGGIRNDAGNVSIMVGVDARTPGASGLVAFEAGTSSGNAWLFAHQSGRVAFKEGSDAGASTISILKGGAVDFRAASAKQSAIINSGKLDFISSSAGDANIANNVAGEVLFSESSLERARVANSGYVDLWATSGGESNIDNSVKGTIVANGASLEKLKLDNEGAVFIANAFGGNALVNNRASGEVTFFDTTLENIHLSNEGSIGLAGKTTADNAIVKMSGGMLDVSYVGDLVDDSFAVKTGTHKAITIGSLSGTGNVVTGATEVTLGSANQDDAFGGRFVKTVAGIEPRVEGKVTAETTELAALRTPAVAQTTQGVQLTKIGTGNLTLSGDQSDIDRLSVQGGTLTATHANALGSGTVSVASAGTVALGADVSGVTDITNAGTIELGTNKLAVRKYASSEGAKLNSRVAKQGEDLAFGAIQVSESSDFRATKINVAVDDGIEVTDLLKQQVTVVDAPGDAEVQIGEVEFGSISTGDGTDGGTDGNSGGRVTITETSAVNFLGADGGYNANEQAALASVDGVALGDLASGKIGGSVLSAMALQTAGSEEQRRSARLLSGESLVNNATTAQGAATSFQRGMQ
ncbi:hypothetical protein, partial [Pandoraea terrigena]|uniref:hypothetical protein n=1 Tax=Pandoraea terrigena TaxID=2508292 RepID=UPI0012411278